MSVYLYIDTKRNTERKRERERKGGREGEKANWTSKQLVNVVEVYVGILKSFAQFFCKFKITSK